MKRLCIAVVSVVLLMGLVSAIGCGDQQHSDLKEQAGKTTDELVHKESASFEDPRTSVEGSVGESVRLGDVEVKIVSWQFATPDDYDKPYERPENILVVADVEVTNNSPMSYQCDSTNNMRIRTPEGYEYEEWDYALPDPQFPSTDIDPGEKSRGFVSFEVPKSISSMVFQFDSYENGKAKIKLQ